MKNRIYILLFAFVAFFTACNSTTTPLSLHWEFGQNDVEPGICEAYLTLTNTSEQELTHEDWTLYFNLMSLHPIYTEGEALRETEIQASWHSIEPTQTFAPLAPGESREYTLRYKGSAIRENICPEGFFLILNSKFKINPKPISIPCTYAPYTRPEQMKRGIVTWEKTPYADGEYVFDYVERVLGDKAKEVQPLLPQPKQMTYADGVCEVAKAEIISRTDANMVKEGYTMIISPDTIRIEASDEAGVFYAMQTLKQWGDTIPCGRLIDYPDLPHRGIMLDVVRNYYPVDSIYRILDMMA